MENPSRGILLLIGATLMFSTSDALAKFLGSQMPIIQVTWIRYVVFLVMAGAMVGSAAPVRLRVSDPRAHILRGLGLVGSALFFFFALLHMPLADASAVGFASPLIITALSVPMLGEVVGIRRWSAVLVGLVGVLIIVRPGTGAFHWAALSVLASSLCWAYAVVLTRRMAGADPASTTLLWTAVTGLVVLSLALPFDFVLPGWWHAFLAILLGVFASGGQWLMLLAYRHAGASVLAPFSYAQLIWAVSYGYLFFNTLPDQWTIVGGIIIVASGVYTVHRERVRARERRSISAA